MSYGHGKPRGYISPLNTTSFADITPLNVRAAFDEIHHALRLGAADAAEDSINALRRAADYYLTATRNSHGL
jgi:hypothetical protein